MGGEIKASAKAVTEISKAIIALLEETNTKGTPGPTSEPVFYADIKVRGPIGQSTNNR
jgi:hypothetical protein